MKKAYFLSDFHLGAAYLQDSKEAESRIVRFLDSIREDCSELYLLGDILDYWYEYKYVVPKGFVRFFGKLADLSDSGIKIVWLIGNHDIWMFDYLPREIGITIADGPIVKEIFGKKCLLAHGDGLGKNPPVFRILRTLFRNRFCQWLYAGIHPRWTVPFALNWSRTSREGNINTKIESFESEPNSKEEILTGIIEWAEAYSSTHPDIDYFIFGHFHLMANKRLSTGKRLIIIGDWLSHFSYAVAEEGEPLTLHRLLNESQTPSKKGF